MDFKDNQVDEEALWRGIQKGDQASFESLYNNFFKSLYSYGRKVCSNSTILEDAIHDLFLDVWRYRASLSPTTSIRFYLFRALRRRIIKNETKDIESSLFNSEADAFFIKKTLSQEDEIIQIERKDERENKLKKQLSTLPPRQYESLILRFYDEFSYVEIASLLGVNEQSARNLVQRGLEQLRHFAKILVLLIWILISKF